MGYPVGVLVEDGIIEIAHLKLKIGVNDWFYTVVILHNIQPLKH